MATHGAEKGKLEIVPDELRPRTAAGGGFKGGGDDGGEGVDEDVIIIKHRRRRLVLDPVMDNLLPKKT